MPIPDLLQTKLNKYKDRFPVPVISLANDLGIEVYETDDLTDRQSGSIRKEDGKYVIYVNERHPATRKAFTIAHEIAHYGLHKNLLDEGEEHVDSIGQLVGDRHDQLVLNREDGAILDEKEKQREKDANYLAAEILMPKNEFIKTFEIANTVEEVAEKFGVSPAAAAIRAKYLLGEVIF